MTLKWNVPIDCQCWHLIAGHDLTHLPYVCTWEGLVTYQASRLVRTPPCGHPYHDHVALSAASAAAEAFKLVQTISHVPSTTTSTQCMPSTRSLAKAKDCSTTLHVRKPPPLAPKKHPPAPPVTLTLAQRRNKIVPPLRTPFHGRWLRREGCSDRQSGRKR